MAYASKALMITRWGSDEVLRSADRDPQDGTADDATITAHCSDASSLVDSYLARAGYTTPVDPVPAVLVLKTTDIAVYTLSYDVGGAHTEVKRKRYEDALAWLEKIAKGELKLPGADGGDASEPAAAKPVASVTGTQLAYQFAHTRGLV